MQDCVNVPSGVILNHSDCPLLFVWYVAFSMNVVAKRGDLPKKGGRGNENSKHTQ